MAEYTVTLSGAAYVNAQITVEADSMEDAERQAIARADEASWPVDDQGDDATPDDLSAVFATYLRNDDTADEKWPDEPAHVAIRDAAPEMLAALKVARSALTDAGALIALAAVNHAIAKAEGRSNG